MGAPTLKRYPMEVKHSGGNWFASVVTVRTFQPDTTALLVIELEPRETA